MKYELNSIKLFSWQCVIFDGKNVIDIDFKSSFSQKFLLAYSILNELI